MDKDDNKLWITESGVGGQTHKPFVVFGQDGGTKYQVEAESARQLGHSLIEAAEAADRDADLFALLVGKLGQPPELAAQLLGDLRVVASERREKTV